MSTHTTSIVAGCLASLVVPLAASTAMADVTLTSSDGRWVATVKDSGGGAGQCTSMKDMSLAPAYRNFVANTIHYVRMGSPALFGNYETQRLESLFTTVRFVAESDNFTAVLAANDLSGTLVMVNGEMVPGAAGGMRVSLTFMDAAPSATALLQTAVKPFVYANMNVDGDMSSNVGNWVGGSPDGHFWQKRNGSPANSERWFVGAGVDAVQAMQDSFMQQYLDDGAISLVNQVMTGPGDINTAMSWPSANINDASYTVNYGLGNVNLFVAPTFGASPTFQIATLVSPDLRWHAEVQTTFDFIGNFAGFLQKVVDTSRPEPENNVLGAIVQLASVGPNGTEPIGQMVGLTTGLHMWITPTSHRSTAILRHNAHPGLVTIIDGLMLAGDTGGYVGCTTHVDTGSGGLFVRGFLDSDVDINGYSMNQGGLEGDHFWFTAPSSQYGDVRWIRTTPIESYMLAPLNAPWAKLMNNQPLDNTVETGTMDLELAVGYEAHQLSHNVPFIYGFAVGNPDIAIPASFCTPTATAPCVGDLTGDGTVDAADLSILLGNWGPWQPTSPDSDFNNDGVTDAADLSVMLGAWGSCG